MCREIGVQADAFIHVWQLFAGDDAVSQTQLQFYPGTYQWVTHAYQRGASYCRDYLLHLGHYCASCPLISQEERLRRQRAWMKRLVDAHGTSAQG